MPLKKSLLLSGKIKRTLLETIQAIMQNEFNSMEDSEEQSSALETLRALQPFALPKDYFEGLEERISAACKEEEETRAELPKENPFHIPAGYFDNLAARSLKLQQRKKSRTLPLKRYLPLAAAAVLLLCAGIGFYPSREHAELSPQDKIAALDQQSVSDYVNENIDDFDDALLEESTTIDPADLNTFSNEDIRAYLDSEDGIPSNQKTN